jgi:hypothetical protein
MIRGVTLTLSAVLTLGDVIGALGDDLSGQVAATSNAMSLPSWGGVLPRLPENWSDLPVRFRVSESVGYNSNVLGFATNTPVLGGQSRGDFQSISSYGASTSANWGGQQFFVDGSYGFTRYLHDVSLNSHQYAIDAGLNWIYTSRCSGTLVGSETLSASPFGQQVASAQINNVTSTTFNGSAKCVISNDYSANLSTGLSRTTNSTLANQLNDSRTRYVSAGITYSVAETHTINVALTVTGSDFTGRGQTANNLGLANAITQDSLNVTYTRIIDPNLLVTVSAGAVGVTNGAFSLAAPSGIVPQYSASVNWAATPKLSMSASVARTVSPPQAVVGNAQITESASLVLNYQISPKMGFSANAATAYSTSTFTQIGGVALQSVAAGALTSQKSYSAGASLSYSITPFIGASLNYQFSRLVQTGSVTPQNLVLLNVNYNPY